MSVMKRKIRFFYLFFSLIQYTKRIEGDHQILTHIRNPVTLSVGECISFQAKPTYDDGNGSWTWRKDTISVDAGSSRIVANEKVLKITDVQVEDSAYYSAEFQTDLRTELFKFWLNVQGCSSNEHESPVSRENCQSRCQKKCDQGWSYFQGVCYKYFGEIKSWEDALDSCLSQSARLAVVDNVKRNNFVATLLESGEGAWIGLNDRHTESTYVWNNDMNAETSYFQWANNEPSNTNSICNVENCVEMKYPNLKWNDMICNGHNAYVCQIVKNKINESTSWSCTGNNCYKYFPTLLIWKDAKMKCEQFGGELARITSSSLNAFVGKLIMTNIWIGLNDIAEPGTYVWKDFEVGKLSNKASFFNWDSGEPNDKLYDHLWREQCSGEDCVQLSNWGNAVTWKDTECSNKIPYVCEKKDSFLTLAAALGISLGCTAVTIIIAAVIQSRLKSRKQNAQLQKLVFNASRFN